MTNNRMRPLSKEEFDDIVKRRAWGEIWVRFGRRNPGPAPSGKSKAELSLARVRRCRKKKKDDSA